MQQEWKIREIDTEICSKEMVTKDDNDVLGVDWTIILKMHFKEIIFSVCESSYISQNNSLGL
jgi:hypothetical protein